MTPLEIVGLVAIILISAFAIVAIIIAVPLFRLINRIKFMAGKLNESLIPTVEKLNDTVTSLNTEISSIADLTQSVSSIVEQLEKIIRLARILITSPIIKIISASAGLFSGLSKSKADAESENEEDEK
jgi:predicted PurR-regulated permease PerM